MDDKLLLTEYLTTTEIIDWKDERIVSLAQDLRGTNQSEESIAKWVFEWVRDNIQHSTDYDRCEVTCLASDTLQKRTGFCYAKSHLLAALLRASGIPVGFCYQRVSVKGDGPPYCLHGLNAIHLQDYGWYRVDARGNRKDVQAEFTPPQEQLAFSTEGDGEYDFPEIWSEPLAVVVQSLRNASSVQVLAKCFPDLLPEDMASLRADAAGKVVVLT